MLVLDANILIRAVLGRKVRWLLVQYGRDVQFYAPESAFAEAREHLPRILLKRSIPVNEGLDVLDTLKKIVQPIAIEALATFEQDARERMRGRD